MKLKIVLISAMVFGCSDQHFKSLDEGEDADAPAIQVDPTYIEFGTLRESEEVIRTFVISSIGGRDLVLDSVEFAGTPLGFTLLTTDLAGLVLPPETSTEVDVAFTPMSTEEYAQVVVASNDEDKPEVGVELIGEGAVPELSINPNPLDMGVTYLGCDKNNEVELKNIGTDALEIYEILHSGGAIDMTSTPDLPLTLDPAETATVYFNFSPDEVAEVAATLTVNSNEPLETRDAAQTGSGEYAAEYEDEWEVPEDPPSDIVFYVDQSCSMEDDHTRLVDNFSTFITELNTYSMDWQIIVANQDTGCNSSSGVLRPVQPDYITRFQSGVTHGSDGGWGFFYTEAGLTVTSEAIEMTDPGECNNGFMRPEAMLHIIMVSDEPEQSPMAWNHYVDKVIAKKGSASNVKFSAVAGDYPGGCPTAEAGTGYYDAVNATGGVFLSICSEWATPTNLSMLAAASIQQSAFELSATPDPVSIRVFVNGTERVSGWIYDGPTNTVVFEEAIPAEGDHIRITYGGLTICD